MDIKFSIVSEKRKFSYEFTNHCTDLQILPVDVDSEDLFQLIANEWDWKLGVEKHYSSIEGQTWYGKCFLEVPFMFPCLELFKTRLLDKAQALFPKETFHIIS